MSRTNVANALPKEKKEIPSCDLLVSPKQSVSGQAIFPHPIVSIHGADGQGISNIPVLARLKSGSFSSGSTVEVLSDNEGKAVFSNLVINEAMPGYVVAFLAEGIGEKDTPEFNVRFVPPRKMSVINEPLDSVVGQAIEGSPSVFVTDLAGNPVRGVNVMVSANTAEPLPLEGGKVVQTDNAGIAIFADLVSRTPVTNCQLHFDPAVAGVNAVESQTFNILSRP
jgi:hypothetical protein